MNALGSAMRLDACSGQSLAAGETLSGSAPTAPVWLLVELPGQWGPKPPAGCGFSGAVERHLTEVNRAHGVRLQLVRRHTRERGRALRSGRPRRFFLADVRPGHRRVLVGDYGDEEDLLHVPVAAFGTPGRASSSAEGEAGLTPWHEPLILVCTHAKRDACCALYGRQVATSLEQRFGDRLWETTHTGGHRFAANVVVLPGGVVFGRLSRDNAVDVVGRYLDGELVAQHFRGWAHQDAWSQAAEWFARTELGLEASDGVSALTNVLEGERATVVVTAPAGRWRLDLRRRPLGELRVVSCGKPPEEDPGEIGLVALEPLDPPAGPGALA